MGDGPMNSITYVGLDVHAADRDSAEKGQGGREDLSALLPRAGATAKRRVGQVQVAGNEVTRVRFKVPLTHAQHDA